MSRTSGDLERLSVGFILQRGSVEESLFKVWREELVKRERGRYMLCLESSYRMLWKPGGREIPGRMSISFTVSRNHFFGLCSRDSLSAGGLLLNMLEKRVIVPGENFERKV